MKPGSDIGTRIMGLFLFIVGAGLGYWQLYLPIMQASRGEPNISYFTEAAAIAPIGMLFGLFLAIFGARGLEFLAQRPSRLVMVIIVVFTLTYTFGCIFGMEYIMKSFGYY